MLPHDAFSQSEPRILTAAILQMHNEVASERDPLPVQREPQWRRPIPFPPQVSPTMQYREGVENVSYPPTPSTCYRNVDPVQITPKSRHRSIAAVQASVAERSLELDRNLASMAARSQEPERNVTNLVANERQRVTSTVPGRYWWEECTERDEKPFKCDGLDRRDDFVRFDPGDEIDDDKDAPCDEMCGISGRSKTAKPVMPISHVASRQAHVDMSSRNNPFVQFKV